MSASVDGRPDAAPVIRIDRLGHAYQPGRWVFMGYTLDIPRGAVFSILGPNGRGKSTLLHILLGLLKPTAGSVRVSGRMAFVPQLFQVAFDYSMSQMVMMGRARRIGLFRQPSPQDGRIVIAALERFGLVDLADRPFHELSGGQRQLVIFARALVAEAEILLLDEPTSSLDIKNQGLVLDWMARLVREEGLTVVFTTHHPHHALAVADQSLLMLEDGKFLCGNSDGVLTEENLHALYGSPIKRLQFEYQGCNIDTFAPVFLPPRARPGPRS